MNKQGGGERFFEAKSPPPSQPLPPPSQQQPLQCPRCESIETKFCYYNNNNVSQPRYFCKTCRRHWTQGGKQRNVPIGGGTRKRKRSPTKNLPSSSCNINNPNMLNFPTSTPFENISSSSLTPPTYCSSGGYGSTLQPFNQVGTIGSDFGGSSLGLVQEFNLPSFTTPQQQHHQNQQGLMENLIFRPNKFSTGTQKRFNYPALSSRAQGLYWSNNKNNSVVSISGASNSVVDIGSSLDNHNQRRTGDQLEGFGLPPTSSPSSPSLLQ
ncbi:hypothetical protein GIB67_008481 [Kingdonia uniflora]|uniref:Dof zinc finger protein n=1 Tax=Kingdonia uniflora TaxID=39325 RepID=A0A7J7N5N4_9MAGN|nr:hypothetical protein GIB67_008481 [Kingdonia uniflora]